MQSLSSPQSHVNASSTLPLILIDFDQTITTKDTIGPLGQFGVWYTHNPKPWSYFVDSYLEDYRRHRDQLPDTPAGDFKAFVKQLDSYQPIERRSQARVSQHKVFKGLARHALTQQASTLRAAYLQPGVIEALRAYKDQVRIISLNWSKDWIQGFLQELNVPKQHIYSNDLEFATAADTQEEDTCTGNIIPAILTTGDKQKVIDTFRQQDHKTIYIGDSLGDIEALVEADVGIIIGKDPSLLDALSDFGYHADQDISKTSTLYRVDDWNQINHLLQQHQT